MLERWIRVAEREREVMIEREREEIRGRQVVV